MLLLFRLELLTLYDVVAGRQNNLVLKTEAFSWLVYLPYFTLFEAACNFPLESAFCNDLKCKCMI